MGLASNARKLLKQLLRKLVSRIVPSWNQLDVWLRQVEGLLTVA